MGDLTEGAFLRRVWAPLEAAFGPQTDERRRLYQAVFVGRVDERPIVHAAFRAIETSRWFPTVSELRDLAGLNPCDAADAQAAWEWARAHALGQDAPGGDERARAALQAIGGSRRIALCKSDEVGHLRREFLSTYAAHREADRRGTPTPAQLETRRVLALPPPPAPEPDPDVDCRPPDRAAMTDEERAEHDARVAERWATVWAALGGRPAEDAGRERARDRAVATAEREADRV